MATVSPIATIAVPTICRRFGSGEEAVFESLLRDRSVVDPTTLRHPREILLDEEGKTSGGYRFTTTALSQLCCTLCPGLSTYVASVAGVGYEGDDSRQFSARIAARAINDTIRLRFDAKLAGCGLVLDTDNRVVDGVVGPSYRFFNNLEMLSVARTHANSQGAALFQGAVLAGRRMYVRYAAADRLFAVDTPTGRKEPFHLGWHFANSEVGECAICAAVGLVRRWTSSMSIAPFSGSARTVHFRGSRFDAQLERQLLSLRSNEEAVPLLGPKVVTAMTTSLGLRGSDLTRGAKALLARLRKGGLTNQFATDVVTRAALHGSYRNTATDGSPRDLTDALSESRTVYDLYNALLWAAQRKPPALEERAGTLAYRILDGTFRLPVTS